LRVEFVVCKKILQRSSSRLTLRGHPTPKNRTHTSNRCTEQPIGIIIHISHCFVVLQFANRSVVCDRLYCLRVASLLFMTAQRLICQHHIAAYPTASSITCSVTVDTGDGRRKREYVTVYMLMLAPLNSTEELAGDGRQDPSSCDLQIVERSCRLQTNFWNLD